MAGGYLEAYKTVSLPGWVWPVGLCWWPSVSLCSTEPAAFVIIYLAPKCLKQRGLGGPGIADENIPRYTAGQEGIIYFLFLLESQQTNPCE